MAAMTMFSTLITIATILSVTCVYALTDPFIGSDINGNLNINSESNATVLVNGNDLVTLFSTVSTLQSTVAAQQSTIVALSTSLTSTQQYLTYNNMSSCQRILDANPNAVSGVYNIVIDFNTYPVYCYMDEGLGWALLLKVDGSESTFYYASSLWYSQEPYQPSAYATGLDNTEFKSPLYWVHPISQLLIGMKTPTTNATINWATMDLSSASLQSALEHTGYTSASTPTRAQWEALVGDGSLEPYCNEVGINLQPNSNSTEYVPTLAAYVRIGIIGNDQDDCGSPDSFIGFGGQYFNSLDTVSCGNFCADGCDDGNANTASFGYILVHE